MKATVPRKEHLSQADWAACLPRIYELYYDQQATLKDTRDAVQREMGLNPTVRMIKTRLYEADAPRKKLTMEQYEAMYVTAEAENRLEALFQMPLGTTMATRSLAQVREQLRRSQARKGLMSVHLARDILRRSNITIRPNDSAYEITTTVSQFEPTAGSEPVSMCDLQSSDLILASASYQPEFMPYGQLDPARFYGSQRECAEYTTVSFPNHSHDSTIRTAIQGDVWRHANPAYSTFEPERSSHRIHLPSFAELLASLNQQDRSPVPPNGSGAAPHRQIATQQSRAVHSQLRTSSLGSATGTTMSLKPPHYSRVVMHEVRTDDVGYQSINLQVNQVNPQANFVSQQHVELPERNPGTTKRAQPPKSCFRKRNRCYRACDRCRQLKIRCRRIERGCVACDQHNLPCASADGACRRASEFRC